MADVMRLISTGELVYSLGQYDEKRSYIMFPYKGVSKKGHLADIRVVRNERVKLEKRYGYG